MSKGRGLVVTKGDLIDRGGQWPEPRVRVRASCGRVRRDSPGQVGGRLVLGRDAKEFEFYPVSSRQPLIDSQLGRGGIKVTFRK